MPTLPNFPQMEEDVLKLWEQEDVFKKTLEKPAPQGDFVFYEGPPTANGMPGIHHVEARAFKDIIPRYKTMRGYRVPRQAGWDTHGLPVELEVEKRLGISGKPQIESLKKTPEESIAYFNDECKKSVWKYLDAWIKMTRRIGFWLDLDHPYITYETGYIAKLWGIIKKISDRGLLYKDYKVVPFCPRCGTTLSSHELAQGYDEAEDPSIYVKFKMKIPHLDPPPAPQREETDRVSPLLQSKGGDEEGGFTYLLVWTTTPWTLPGNVALAVKEDAEYVLVETNPPPTPPPAPQREETDSFLPSSEGRGKMKMGDDRSLLILAKARLAVLDGEYEILREFRGRDLVGLEYEPLYNFVTYDKKAHYVAAADFVSLDDGTGIVHTAVMYGVDDFELGEKIGLPKKHVVGPDGKFLPEVKPWAGVFVKDADPLIIKELDSRGLLYKQETIKHTYPFCWRCDTPLLYYARDSWFIKMSKLRDKLIKENKKINWVPEHIRDGRFGEWLREVKDWAFSRERYWGTPLPVWLCECGEQKVVGGLDDLPLSPSGNTYYLLRHGERNDHEIATSDINADSHLTEKGRGQIAAVAKKLKKEKIDVIIASDYPRTLETAKIVSDALGIPIETNERLREIQLGTFDGKTVKEYKAQFPSGELERFEKAPEDGETLTDLVRRGMELINDLERTYRKKKILLVGHGDPLWMLEGAYRGMTAREMIAWDAAGNYIKMGDLLKLPPLRALPRNANGFADLHRPYIDSVTFPCPKCGKDMTRTKEVCDVWFDSGSMPFASDAPGYPADYISEAIDQTRGWFYTLLAVSTLMEKGTPYKNVICLGHLLDVKGQKMSKSRGNVVDPVAMIEKYGADAVRWFMYTVNQPGDTKRFDEKDLDQIVKKVFLILWNVLAFWKTYSIPHLNPPPAPQREETNQFSPLLRSKGGDEEGGSANHILDRWILARLSELVRTTTDNLDSYRVTEAGRAIAEFVTDLSTWYVRRSRERMKTGDGVAVLREVLDVLARLMAPFTPFLAESLWRELGHTTSVHLADWPKPSPVSKIQLERILDTGPDDRLLKNMDLIRRIASLAHEQRAASKIPVRQPLKEATVSGMKRPADELVQLFIEETNVLMATFDPNGTLDVKLNTTLNDDLIAAGRLREVVRAVNDLRKKAHLTVDNNVQVSYYSEDKKLLALMKRIYPDLHNSLRQKSLFNLNSGKDPDALSSIELTFDHSILWLGITKL